LTGILSDIVRGKSVLILGFGREGRSTYKMLTKLGVHRRLGIADMNTPTDFNDPNVSMHCGEGYFDSLEAYDIVFKSPGIVLPRHWDEYKCLITSQTEVFMQAYNRQIIGITGTKGKSTVSTLTYHVLSENGLPCLLAGNIGTPMFEIAESVTDETIIVLELSCHQLEICRFSPSVAVLLNIYEEHLDHYGTLENYANAKMNIYLHQKPLDELFCIDPELVRGRKTSPSRVIKVDTSVLPFSSFDQLDGVKLRGTHNVSNCAVVYSLCRGFGISDEDFIRSVCSYTPLHHRLEFIGQKNGVDYYDDSIATAVESCINAMESINNAATILIGGMDRGIDYTKLVDYLADCRLENIIFMYKSGERIHGMLMERTGGQPKQQVILTADLAEAVETAQRITPEGGACILSPASASYDHFKNFEERGDTYKALLFGE